MVLVLNPDVFDRAFDSTDRAYFGRISRLLGNNQVTICFTREYIDLLDSSVSNPEAFRALIRELVDSHRIKMIDLRSKNLTALEEYIGISTKAKLSSLVPFSIECNAELSRLVPKMIELKKASRVNRHWLGAELAEKSHCNVSYQDFKDDNEIISFFDNVFSLHSYINQLYIFDREQPTKFLKKIKGCNINFYTFFPYKTLPHIPKQVKNELKNQLGGKVKLYYTNNKRLIHERKVLFEGLLLTSDNSHDNLCVAEPTWEIVVTLDSDKSKGWLNKCNSFREVL